MLDLKRVAIVGSGPTALYLLKHIANSASDFCKQITSIDVFEQDSRLGMGMPYSPRTTDHHNMCNISSKELPALETPFAAWLRSQDQATLREFGLSRDDINEDDTYSRLAMGQYFAAQFRAIVARLESAGIKMVEHAECRVVDIQVDPLQETYTVIADPNLEAEFDTIVIASGHQFDARDEPASGYYTSPWPIQKLLPADGQKLAFKIGTLGASLSAFDVISSLAHRHGTFQARAGGGGKMIDYIPDDGCEALQFVMHSAEGWLPHLQYEQEEPFRELYRHVSQEDLESLRDESGFLRLDTYFHEVCRPALIEAFQRDGRDDMASQLSQPDFGIEQFAEQMTSEHEYEDAFDGMRLELPAARRSVQEDFPIHWKEVFDDLMYALNFHADWMPAEDHIRFQSCVMPFLLNVIAAMPLRAARMLLALRTAGMLQLVPGYAKVVSLEDGLTTVQVEGDGGNSTHQYRMFVDCTGQGSLQIEQFPFPSLVESGTVRPARAPFADSSSPGKLPEHENSRVSVDDGRPHYQTGGIDVDNCYRLINVDGLANSHAYDVAFPHTTGVRPYSYGLQACELTARLVVSSWMGKESSCTADSLT
ncbi:FAD/NAD(P)-binding protein [Allorhodopirellula heiligendammensis]|uniref:FAD-dependent urate hydroxylase HpyO/Asp monooxygenase CreE-like FAD/NAD(P)-binding domain-containing protein n=1 Tax=Allorhodopirellula heiligendammensis TaxID=2714739 RepID=A0A5C6BY92_9BACT|nr:FAD/NAD(P)-binding protein [Allorhodopirellula heiligendammensis]TWU15824.1 hypothetical protein Poly21_30260 [Allorhodopirellula heiligendammensis]